VASSWWYPLACVLLPAAVGLLMFGLFELWDRHRRRAKPDDGLPLIDYFI
jgi:hypothetical protein